jgi:hypothetical protein
MIMIVHEAVGVADPVISLIDVLEGVEEVQAVLVILEDGFLLVAARGDVVDGAWVFYAEGASRERTVAE